MASCRAIQDLYIVQSSPQTFHMGYHDTTLKELIELFVC